MNKEAYVKFGTAQRLKEKGFDWECFMWYYVSTIGGNNIHKSYNKPMSNLVFGSDKVSCPTQQMACRWLREVYKVFINISVGTDIDGVFGYMPSIYFLSILSCNEGRFVPNVDADDICDSTPQTYEDAVEFALEYVLKNLI